MFRRISAVILLLLLYTNSSLVVPQTDQIDVFEYAGAEVDEINSLVEYIDELILEHDGQSPEKDDYDFPLFSLADYSDHCASFQFPVLKKPLLTPQVNFSVPLDEDMHFSFIRNIIIPPPEPMIPAYLSAYIS